MKNLIVLSAVILVSACAGSSAPNSSAVASATSHDAPQAQIGGTLKISCENSDGKFSLVPSGKKDNAGQMFYHVYADAALMTDSLGEQQPDGDYDMVPMSFDPHASASSGKDTIDGDGCGVCGIDMTFAAGTLAAESVAAPAFPAHLHSYYDDIASDEKDVDISCKFEAL